MFKKLMITLPILTAIGVLSLYIYNSGRTYYNDDYVTGNTAGNLYNGGLFCEYDKKIFFSNDEDDGSLYSMDLSLSNVKKIQNDKAAYINADDNYLYYVRANNTRDDYKPSILMFYSTGIYRTNHNGSNLTMISQSPAGLLGLSGNYLYYQRYNVETGLDFYYSKIDGSGEKFVMDEAIAPALIHDNTLIYTGVDKDHNLKSMDLETLNSSDLMNANAMLPISVENYLYYIDLDDNYSIYRTTLSFTDTEKIVDARCSTYNITLDGTFLYYQVDDGKNNGIHRLNLKTNEDELIQLGNFKQIHVTSRYVFFKELDDSRTYILAADGTGSLGTFLPPTITKK